MTEGLPQRYRLLRRIGAGGMAEVFRAELVSAEGITRELVIKRVHPRLALDPEAVRRFVDEARVAARLRHPNVVQVYEFGRAGDHYFLAMELVEGCDLAALLRRADDGQLPPGVALAVVEALLDGLGYVHALRSTNGDPLGLVHRDVSPHNVLLGHAGEVKLADFGIAHAAQTSATSTADAGAVMGKLAYMAPEQARGEAVDARADLFSAASVLREMLTGTRAYGTATGENLRERATLGQVEPVALPASLAAFAPVFDRALASARDTRFATAAELRQALRAAAEALGVRPDVDGLRALVAVASGPDAPALAPSDRTLTDAASPEDRGPASPPSVVPAALRKRRVLFERVAIAVGVLVVSVLAERRTRPAARGPSTQRAVVPRGSPLRLGVPAGLGAGWLQPDVRRRLEAAVGARVERVDLGGAVATARALRTGEVDVALVPSESLRALVTTDSVRRLDTLLPEVDGSGYLALRTTLRAETLPWGASVGVAGEGTYALPVAVDLVAFGVRADALQDANECVSTRRAEIETWLRAHHGLRLPSGLGPRHDLGTWTSWDLVAASWCWSRDGSHLAAAEAHDPAGVAATLARWGSLGVTLDGNVPAGDALTPAREAQTLLSSMGAIAGADDASVVARWASLSWWNAHGAEGWVLARPPRGDRLQLDALGDTTEEGGRAVIGRTWGWCLGLGSARAARAARLLLTLANGANGDTLVRDVGGVDATARFTAMTGPVGAFARSALEQSPFVRLDGPASLDDVEALPTRVRDALARRP